MKAYQLLRLLYFPHTKMMEFVILFWEKWHMRVTRMHEKSRHSSEKQNIVSTLAALKMGWVTEECDEMWASRQKINCWWNWKLDSGRVFADEKKTREWPELVGLTPPSNIKPYWGRIEMAGWLAIKGNKEEVRKSCKNDKSTHWMIDFESDGNGAKFEVFCGDGSLRGAGRRGPFRGRVAPKNWWCHWREGYSFDTKWMAKQWREKGGNVGKMGRNGAEKIEKLWKTDRF